MMSEYSEKSSWYLGPSFAPEPPAMVETEVNMRKARMLAQTAMRTTFWAERFSSL